MSGDDQRHLNRHHQIRLSRCLFSSLPMISNKSSLLDRGTFRVHTGRELVVRKTTQKGEETKRRRRQRWQAASERLTRWSAADEEEEGDRRIHFSSADRRLSFSWSEESERCHKWTCDLKQHALDKTVSTKLGNTNWKEFGTGAK